MLKYTDTKITFAEVPDEVTLCINISGCPVGCEGCHSAYLAQDIGNPLVPETLFHLIKSNRGISCVSFMGGDAHPEEINTLAHYVKTNFYCLKTCWYSGRESLAKEVNPANFDYIKLGPYIKEKGGLNSKTTNQKFYRTEQTSDPDTVRFIDITSQFQKPKV